ncbi:MAG: DUF4157 domain-containing protein [Bradymonadales bacterium]|nr:DUF4157 domain-containing protein [Bradymonadales bacterium]
MSNLIQNAKKAVSGEQRVTPPRQDTAPEVQSQTQAIIANEGPEVTAKMGMLYASDQAGYQQVLDGVSQAYGPVAAEQLHSDVMERANRNQERASAGETKDQPMEVNAADVAERIVNRLQGAQESVDQREEEEKKNAPPEALELPPEQQAAEQNIIDQNRSRAEQTAALLNNLGPKIGVDPAKVPIKADQEAKAVAEQHGASGLMMAKDSQVFLHPDEYNPNQKEGQKLLGEEVAHWAQMHNALAGGGTEVTSMPAAESEAKRIAEEFASGRTPAPPQETISQGAVAADVGEQGPPSRVVLNFGGASMEVNIPPTTGSEVTLRGIESPIPGLTLGEATINFDSNWQITGGKVKASVTIGSFVNVTNADLAIREGGGVACSIEKVDLRLGDWGAGKIDLVLSPEGITGSATFTHELVNIGMGIVLLSGLIRIALDNQGNISGVGNLTGDIGGVGTITLNAAAENGILGGTVSFTPQDALQLANGVVLESAILSGNFTKQMFLVTGEGHLKVNDWMEGDVQATYQHPNHSWSASGTLHQIQPQVLGDMTVTDGMIGLKMENSNLTEVEGGGKFTMPQFEGSLGGTYDVGAGQFNGKAQATLLEPLDIGGNGAVLKEMRGEAVIEANKLVEVTADAAVEVPLEGQPTFRFDIFGAGLRTFDKLLSGRGQGRLMRDLITDLGGGSLIVIKEGSSGRVELVDSQPGMVEGDINVDLHTKDGLLASVAGSGAYDVSGQKLSWAEGQATLRQPINLLEGKVQVENVTGNARIEEDKLVSAGGAAKITIPQLNGLTGDFTVNWRNEGGRDVYSGSGKIDFTLNENLGGLIDVEYNEDDTFRIHGEVDYSINELLKGKIGVEVDQNLDPVLSGEFKVEGVELVPGQDLFNFQFPILPGMNFGPYYGVNIKVGADAGLKAALQPLTLTTTIGIEDFHPLQANMPTFTARADLNAGLTFEAAAKPYVGVTLGVKGLEAGIAVEGEVRLSVPVNLTPYAELKGGPEGFGGELGIGVSIVPQLDLFVRPYLFAMLGSEQARKDLAEWQVPLGELFNWEWNGVYKWGDQGESKEEGGAPASTVSPSGGTQNQTRQTAGGVSGFSQSSGGGAKASPGGPQLESPAEREAQQKGGQGGGPMGEMQQKFQEVSEMAEKVANVAYLFGLVMDIVSVASMSGPFAAASVPLYLAYRVFVKGDLSLEKVKKAILDLWSLLQQGFDWIQAHLPDWFEDVRSWVQSSDPMAILRNAGEWWTNNLKALGQDAIDFLNDAGAWGKGVIRGAGQWAMKAAGWAMDVISDVGEGIANTASSAWEAISDLF